MSYLSEFINGLINPTNYDYIYTFIINYVQNNTYTNINKMRVIEIIANTYNFELYKYFINRMKSENIDNENIYNILFKSLINYYCDNLNNNKKKSIKKYVNIIIKNIPDDMIVTILINKLYLCQGNLSYIEDIIGSYIYKLKTSFFINSIKYNDIELFNNLIIKFGKIDFNIILIKIYEKLSNEYLNMDIIECIYNNYISEFKENIYNIIDDFIYIDFNSNSQKFITYLLDKINVNNKIINNIFSNIIIYQNIQLFEYILNRFYKHFSIYRIINKICMNMNYEHPILFIDYIFKNKIYDELDNLFEYFCINNNHKMIELFTFLFPYKYNNLIIVEYNNYLIPNIDIFIFNNHIKIIKNKEKKECCICYNDSNIILNCEHNVCINCIKIWTQTANTCPMCRTKILFNQSYFII